LAQSIMEAMSFLHSKKVSRRLRPVTAHGKPRHGAAGAG